MVLNTQQFICHRTLWKNDERLFNNIFHSVVIEDHVHKQVSNQMKVNILRVLILAFKRNLSS